MRPMPVLYALRCGHCDRAVRSSATSCFGCHSDFDTTTIDTDEGIVYGWSCLDCAHADDHCPEHHDWTAWLDSGCWCGYCERLRELERATFAGEVVPAHEFQPEREAWMGGYGRAYVRFVVVYVVVVMVFLAVVR